MKNYNSYTLILMIPDVMESRLKGKILLDLLVEMLPDFTPEFIQNYEPIKTPYISVDDTLNFWRWPLLWKRTKNIKCNGDISMMNVPFHTKFCIYTEVEKIPEQSMLQFIQCASQKFSTHLSYINLTTQRELECLPYKVWHPIDLGLNTHDLRKGIPLLPWATVFGKPYVEMLGIDFFLNAPAQTVIRLPDDQVYIQITESLDDIRYDYDNFSSRRVEVMNHLSCLFQGTQVGVRVPPEIMSPITV